MDIFLEFLKSILFGLLEGITEWLPISSTGHMIVLESFWGFTSSQGKDFFDFYLVLIQLGAILAVILTFFHELWPFGASRSHEEKKEIWLTWLKIFTASIPAGIVGVFFGDWLEEHLYGYLTVAITLIVYGVFFLALEYGLKGWASKNKENNELAKREWFRIHDVHSISIPMALWIGLAQVLALIPGTSRSGITICVALLLAIDRETSAKFSFYLSIPAMLGGTLIKSIQYGLHVKQGNVLPLTGVQVGLILVGMAVAFVVSLFVVRFFLKILKKHTFIGFGYYRIAFGTLLLILFFTLPSLQTSLPIVAFLC